MQPIRYALGLALVLLGTNGVAGAHAPNLAIEPLDVAGQPKIKILAEKFSADKPIAETNSAYDGNRSPSLSWNAVQRAKSYLLIVEDPDAQPATFVHWVMWNIPPKTTSLIEGMQTNKTLTDPAGAMQGVNGSNAIGYYGPHPPKGDAAHHYHFEVFALGRMLDVPAGASRDQVVAAATGNVIAAGELVSTYAAPSK